MKLKKILTAVLVIIILLAAFRIISKVAGGKKAQEERVIPVAVANPTFGDIEKVETLTGDVRAQSEVNVRPRTAGRVQEIFVKEGDYVKRGDKLLSFLDGVSEESEIYEDMIVRAPISGVVGIQLLKVGEQVTSTVGLINPVFVLYDINNVKVYADVPEKDFSLIRKGMPANIRLDAYQDRVFRGRVSSVRPVIDPQSRTTQVEIILPNSNGRIKPGMFAKVDLVLQKKNRALVIPFDAVLGETEKYVFVNQNNVAVKKPVAIGLQQDDMVEVITGLSALDRVIVLGQRVVKEGAKVEEAKS